MEESTIWMKKRLQLFMILFYLMVCLVLFSFEGDGANLPDLNNPETLLQLKLAQVFSVFLIFILPSIAFCRYFREEKSAFLQLHSAPRFFPYAVAAITLIFFALPMVSLLGEFNTNIQLPESLNGIEAWMKRKEKSAQELTEAFLSGPGWGTLISNLVVMAIMAALSEEIFFRGLLQKVLGENGLNKHLAVWVAAILFSAFHMQFYGFIPRLALGVLLGYLYLISDNLWVPIIAHTVNNAFAVIVSWWAYNSGKTEILENESMGTGGIILGLLSFAAVTFQLYMLYRFSENEKKEELS